MTKKKTQLQEQQQQSADYERLRLRMASLKINLPKRIETDEERSARLARYYAECYSAH